MKKINTWLNQKKTTLSSLRQQIYNLNKLTEHLQNCLPEEWIDYCQIVRCDAQEKLIVLSTSEQSLMTPLRYMQNQVLAQLKKQAPIFKAIEKIEIIFTPQASNKSATRKAKLSNDAAESCRLAAEKCPPALKQALEKLSDTLKKQN